jgi:hypothetical protein
LVYSIVDGTISGILGWASIESSWGATGVLLTITSIGAEGTIRILVSACCGGECLQVGDDCIMVSY